MRTAARRAPRTRDFCSPRAYVVERAIFVEHGARKRAQRLDREPLAIGVLEAAGIASLFDARIDGVDGGLLQYMLERIAEDGYQLLLEPVGERAYVLIALRSQPGAA